MTTPEASTPSKWFIAYDGTIRCEDKKQIGARPHPEFEEKQERIILCVNSHDKLVAALKEIEDIGNWASDGRAQQLADRLLTVTGIAQSALKELTYDK